MDRQLDGVRIRSPKQEPFFVIAGKHEQSAAEDNLLQQALCETYASYFSIFGMINWM